VRALLLLALVPFFQPNPTIHLHFQPKHATHTCSTNLPQPLYMVKPTAPKSPSEAAVWLPSNSGLPPPARMAGPPTPNANTAKKAAALAALKELHRRGLVDDHLMPRWLAEGRPSQLGGWGWVAYVVLVCRQRCLDDSLLERLCQRGAPLTPPPKHTEAAEVLQFSVERRLPPHLLPAPLVPGTTTLHLHIVTLRKPALPAGASAAAAAAAALGSAVAPTVACPEALPGLLQPADGDGAAATAMRWGLLLHAEVPCAELPAFPVFLHGSSEPLLVSCYI
jgi:hypothetical protein